MVQRARRSRAHGRSRGVRRALALAAACAAALAGASAAQAAAPRVVDDVGTLAPGLRTTIPVLANDSDPDGDALSVVTNTQPRRGRVECTASECTYIPPLREDLPADDSDEVASADEADAFTYTVADPAQARETATVRLEPVAGLRRVARRTRGAAARRCPGDPTRRSRRGQGVWVDTGRDEIRASRVRCPVRRGAQGPRRPTDAVGLAVFRPGLPTASAAAGDDWRFRFDRSFRCTFRDDGPYESGLFGVSGWIKELGATSTDRFTMRYRMQVFGRDFYDRPKWVNLRSQRLTATPGYPDPWTTWSPGSGRFRWEQQVWGAPIFVEQHGPFRVQARFEWIDVRSLRRDALLRWQGWDTLCQGQPSGYS